MIKLGNKHSVIKAILIAIAAALLLAGCGGISGGSSASIKDTSHMDASGDTAAAYKANCVSCHGTDLQGRMGPVTNLQQVGARMTEQEIVAQIEQGKGSMPPFKNRLTEEEIAGLAAWLAGKTE